MKPIREKRAELEKDPEMIYEILRKGNLKAEKIAAQTLKEVKQAMKIDYFGGKNGKV